MGWAFWSTSLDAHDESEWIEGVIEVGGRGWLLCVAAEM